MQITKNFKLDEFTCRDGSVVPDEYLPNVEKLCENLQILRDISIEKANARAFEDTTRESLNISEGANWLLV